VVALRHQLSDFLMLLDLFRSGNGRTVSINHKPKASPWGGGNQFVWTLKGALQRLGYRVQHDLSGDVDVIVMIDPRTELRAIQYGPAEMAAYKKAHPKTKVLHRINECDKRKNSDFMDKVLAEGNKVADFTVFVSEWLRDHSSTTWFDRSRPHAAIYSGADPAIYHPFGTKLPEPSETVRIVTHHWSNNMLKGFDVYGQVDEAIAAGKLPGYELWVIGRWPEGMTWKAARTFPPNYGHKLADQLRQCHLYLTASRWDPCGMHYLEGAQCGLPMVYHEDGGGSVESVSKYGVGFRGDGVLEAIREARARLPELRQRVLTQAPSGARMALAYAELIQRLILEA
jgi:hypothetical protein